MSLEFKNLILKKIPVIDVRAPVEFATGHWPNAVNLPILNDEERQLVGTAYKQQGQDTAVALGHEIVSGQIKNDRVVAWVSYFKNHPNAVITCFRGGLRSQIAQSWVNEAGYQVPRIKGGYKALRRFLIDELARLSEQPLLVISGSTGTGKTLLIKELEPVRPTIDLEFLAQHRGSAFGAYHKTQPAQAQFENLLAAEFINQEDRKSINFLLIEDESRMIGRCMLPEKLFLNMRASEIILLEEPLDQRVQVIFDDYILKLQKENRLQDVFNYAKALQIIAKKIGSQRFIEVSADLNLAINQTLSEGQLEGHKIWIEKLLVWYYDSFYIESLKKRKPQILFKGSRAEAISFLKQR